MQTLEAVGNALRDHRESRNLTLQQAAQLIGTHHTGLSRIERGQQNATVDMLLRMATAYGVTLGQLFSKTTAEPPAAAVGLCQIGVTSAGEIVLDESKRHGFTLADYSLAGSNAGAMIVPDDAMIPILQPGDVAAVDLNDTKIHTTGGIFAIVIDGQPAIRRLFPAPAGTIVQTANPIYPDLHMSRDNREALRIIGRVKVARRRSGF